MTKIILIIDAWLNQMHHYWGIFASHGWDAMCAAIKLSHASNQVGKVYGYMERESELHDEQMTYLRVELDKCRKRVYEAQRQLHGLREARP